MNLAKVFDDIVREYGSETGAWDSDFTLGCTPDEMLAYALHFHKLAPTFNVGLDWVFQYSPFSLGDETGDRFYNQVLCDTSGDVQAYTFAHLCVSIYAQAVNGGAS